MIEWQVQEIVQCGVQFGCFVGVLCDGGYYEQYIGYFDGDVFVQVVDDVESDDVVLCGVGWYVEQFFE